MAQEQQEPTPLGRRLVWRRRWTLRLVLIATVLAGLTLFAAANYAPVELRLVVWEGEVRVSWIGLGALAIGFVLGVVAARLAR